MPNGFYGSKEMWDRLEAPLRELDPVLEEYAGRHNLKIEKNYHDWPSRALSWTADGICRVIQIYPDNGENCLFNLWVAASRDHEGKRYWKNVFIRKAVPIANIRVNCGELLDIARATVTSWQSCDLEFTVNLK